MSDADTDNQTQQTQDDIVEEFDRMVFPQDSLLPRQYTQVKELAEESLEFDGRNVLVVILDTGVDPGAPGLQVTSDGKNKIVDLLDASGAGDVSMFSSQTLSPDSTLLGISGRTLHIPSTWTNHNNQFLLGLKPGYDFFPKKMIVDYEKMFSKKSWKPAIQSARASLQYHKTNPKSKTVLLNGITNQDNMDDLEESLNFIEKKHSYLGPVYDVVAYYDTEEKCYRACLDVSCCGDLSAAKLMREFRHAQEFDTLEKNDFLLNFSFVFHPPSAIREHLVMEVVSCASAHGTHVASICSANFPDNPECNGLAPGAQIISIKIGDNRLDGMETGISFARVFEAISKAKCDIANLSFGESCHVTNTGRVIKLMQKCADDCLMVCSAGNSGPCLSTVGCPGGTTDKVLGVGAVLFPDVARAAYSCAHSPNLNMYHWSSRGPSSDGGCGVSVVAPGAACTSVPNYTGQCRSLLNGTSMAAPNAAGSLACLVSALKSHKISYCAQSLLRAVVNTARPLDIPGTSNIDFGHGLLQVKDTLSYLRSLPKDLLFSGVRFKVRINDGDTRRGIYVRELSDSCVHTVWVEPTFSDSVTQTAKVALSVNCMIECSESWVSVPQFFTLQNTRKSFIVRLNKESLSPGVYFATINLQHDGYCIVSVPVTLIIPSEETSWTNSLVPGQLARQFLTVPLGTAGVTISVSCLDTTDDERLTRLFIQRLQLEPGKAFKTTSCSSLLNVSRKHADQFTNSVIPGRTLELTVSRNWDSSGPSSRALNFKVELQWLGLCPEANSITVISGAGTSRVRIRSSISREELYPSLSLTHCCVVLRPTDSVLTVASDSSQTPQVTKPVYRLTLTYSVTAPRQLADVVFSHPPTVSTLYECAFEYQLWMLFDSNKRQVGAGDAYKHMYTLKLDKGTYTLMLMLRHDDLDTLNKYKDTAMLMQYKLSNTISIDMYENICRYQKSKKFSSRIMPPNSLVSLYFANPSDSAINKSNHSVAVGNVLTGNLSLYRDDKVKKAVTYPFSLVLTDVPSKKSKIKGKGKGESPPNENLKDQVNKKLENDNLVGVSDTFTDPEVATDMTLDVATVALTTTSPSHPTAQLAQSPVQLQNDGAVTAKVTSTNASNSGGVLQRIMQLDVADDEGAEKSARDNLKDLLINDLVLNVGKSNSKEKAEEYYEELCLLMPHHLQLHYNRVLYLDSQPEDEVVLLMAKPAAAIFSQIEDNVLLAELAKKTNPNQALHEERKKILLDTIVRYGCQLLKSGDSAFCTTVEELYQRLVQFTSPPDLKVLAFTFARAYKLQNYGTALKLLLKHIEDQPSIDKEREMIKILKELNLCDLAVILESQLPIKYPPQHRLF